MSQHAGLTVERWRSFSHPQRILMIANEMNRASRLVDQAHANSRQLCYERVLRLVDLTIAAAPRSSVRREMLRWRDLAAELYLADRHEPDFHRAAVRALLQQTPESAGQIRHLGC